MTRATAAGCAVLLIAAVAVPASAKPAKWTLKLESGAEYDSNIHRVEVPEQDQDAVAGAPLIRSSGELTTSWQRKRGERFRFVGLGLAKLFASEEGQSENVIVVAGDGQYQWALNKRGAVFGVRGSYYEAFAYDLGVVDSQYLGRNFSMGNIEADLTAVGPKGHRLMLHAGYRRFVYKPDADFDWHGDHYGLRFETTVWRGDPDKDLDAASMDIAVGYRVGRRSYNQGRAFSNSCPDDDDPDPSCFTPTDFARADLNHQGSIDVAYNTGARIWSARYELQINDSNSFGHALARSRLELGLTAELGKSMSVTASVAVLFNIFLDPLLLGDERTNSFITIDDENRNTLSLMALRKLNKKWSLEARYSIFTNEFATQQLRFRRQVFYTGLAYAYD